MGSADWEGTSQAFNPAGGEQLLKVKVKHKEEKHSFSS